MFGSGSFREKQTSPLFLISITLVSLPPAVLFRLLGCVSVQSDAV